MGILSSVWRSEGRGSPRIYSASETLKSDGCRRREVVPWSPLLQDCATQLAPSFPALFSLISLSGDLAGQSDRIFRDEKVRREEAVVPSIVNVA